MVKVSNRNTRVMISFLKVKVTRATLTDFVLLPLLSIYDADISLVHCFYYWFWTFIFVCVRNRGWEMFFFGKFGVFCCFLVISVLRFALLPYYRRTVVSYRLIWWFWLIFVSDVVQTWWPGLTDPDRKETSKESKEKTKNTNGRPSK